MMGMCVQQEDDTRPGILKFRVQLMLEVFLIYYCPGAVL